MFVGRWQPFHNGHKWLISQKLDKNIPVLICVRDIEPDERNPFTTRQTVSMIETVYQDDDVTVIIIPDIESVNYGRGVGYEINEHAPSVSVSSVSATNIRNCIQDGDTSWHQQVDEKIHDTVSAYLTANNNL